MLVFVLCSHFSNIPVVCVCEAEGDLSAPDRGLTYYICFVDMRIMLFRFHISMVIQVPCGVDQYDCLAFCQTSRVALLRNAAALVFSPQLGYSLD